MTKHDKTIAELEAAIKASIDGTVKQAFLLCRLAAARLDIALEEKPFSALRTEIADLYQLENYLLRCYCRKENWDADGAPREHIPIQIASTWANTLEYLVAGQLPEMIDALLTPGRTAAGPHERRDMGLAVAYARGVEMGLIDDRHPTKTIATTFGISPRTVQKWRQEFHWVEPAMLISETPAAELSAELLKRFLAAGARYQRAGRGKAAINHRASKRKKAVKART